MVFGAMRMRLQRLSREQRWAVMGIVVAHVMVVALYVVLVDNIAKIESKRLASEQSAQEHHRCAMMLSRIEQSQCLVALKIQEAPPAFLAEQ
jgi:hypothetical protein